MGDFNRLDILKGVPKETTSELSWALTRQGGTEGRGRKPGSRNSSVAPSEGGQWVGQEEQSESGR